MLKSLNGNLTFCLFVEIPDNRIWQLYPEIAYELIYFFRFYYSYCKVSVKWNIVILNKNKTPLNCKTFPLCNYVFTAYSDHITKHDTPFDPTTANVRVFIFKLDLPLSRNGVCS